MKLRSLVCVLALAMAPVACDRGADIEENDGIAMNDDMGGDVATPDEPAGTSGFDDPAADQAGRADQFGQDRAAADQNRADMDQQARNELPRTASPLALTALLGLLSLGGAAALRFFR